MFYETVHRVRGLIRFSHLHSVSLRLFCYQLRTALESRITTAPVEVDMLNWMSRTALELVGQGGLGYSFDPLTQDIQHPFGSAIKDIV